MWFRFWRPSGSGPFGRLVAAVENPLSHLFEFAAQSLCNPLPLCFGQVRQVFCKFSCDCEVGKRNLTHPKTLSESTLKGNDMPRPVITSIVMFFIALAAVMILSIWPVA